MDIPDRHLRRGVGPDLPLIERNLADRLRGRQHVVSEASPAALMAVGLKGWPYR